VHLRSVSVPTHRFPPLPHTLARPVGDKSASGDRHCRFCWLSDCTEYGSYMRSSCAVDDVWDECDCMRRDTCVWKFRTAPVWWMRVYATVAVAWLCISSLFLGASLVHDCRDAQRAQAAAGSAAAQPAAPNTPTEPSARRDSEMSAARDDSGLTVTVGAAAEAPWASAGVGRAADGAGVSGGADEGQALVPMETADAGATLQSPLLPLAHVLTAAAPALAAASSPAATGAAVGRG
jgi:hypothetical protein